MLIEKKNDPRVNMGWIPYWNLVPLKAEIKRAFGATVQFSNGHPSTVNRWLAEAAVDIAPCSSICLVQNPQFNIAAPIGVAADGAVQSVFLGFTKDQLDFLDLIKSRNASLQEIFRHSLTSFPEDPRRASQFIWQNAAAGADSLSIAGVLPLNLTPNSATSVMLSRLLYRLWFGETALEQNVSGANSASGNKAVDLLIGDEALLRRSHYAEVIDLGQIWKDLTGLPFVFAVCQSVRPLSSSNIRMLSDAADLAQARMRIEPSDYLPDLATNGIEGRSVDLPAYWKVIQYRLDSAHMRGLALFFALSRQMIQAPADGDLVVKIMRWHAAGPHC